MCFARPPFGLIGREFRLGIGDGPGVVADEPGAFLTERRGVQISEAVALLVDGFAVHADNDAAVGEGVGKAADGGHGFGAPDAETH